MSKRAYAIVVSLFLVFVAVFLQHRNPVGREFLIVFVPGLLALNSLQWFLLPKSMMWKVAGFFGSLLIFAALYFPNSRSATSGFANLATFLFLLIATESLVFWFLTPDGPTRQISVAVNVATLYLLLLVAFLYTHGIVDLGFSSGRFLLISPLAALALYLTGTAFKWHTSMQVIFVCVIVQIGMGLFDAGEANNVRWMKAGSLLAVFAALGFATYWAKDWNK